MTYSSLQAHAGYTVIELVTVLAIMAILGAMAWPATADLVERTELASAARVFVGDIHDAQREARATGRRLALVVAPSTGVYATVFPDGAVRGHRLPTALAFGVPDNPASDGVTFRDNTIWIAPRPGPQSSVGAVTIRTRRGAARKVTVSLTGHTSVAVWDGSRWN
jgi:prepilin-type N-terminal cleavage/methylation domain-containing protein